jgi:hypothetical protein
VILPFDPEQAEVVLEPEAPGAGYWVGAPSVRWHAGRVWLTYRRRRPRGVHPDRGYVACIAASDDGLRFQDVARLPKEALGTSSVERTALLPDPRGTGWIWLVSYVDPADGRWRVDGLAADRIEELPRGTRFPVLTAEAIGGEGVKDPVPVSGPDGVYLILSCAERAGEADPAALHGTHDAYNTGLVRCFTGLASSVDGRRWRWHGPILEPGSGWDAYQARLGAVLPAGTHWVGLYDGSASVAENYEERLGVAVSPDLVRWTRLTPEAPAVVSRGATGSVRYADFLPSPDGLWLYFECSRPDGSHDLRRARLAWKPAAPTTAASA